MEVDGQAGGLAPWETKRTAHCLPVVNLLVACRITGMYSGSGRAGTRSFGEDSLLSAGHEQDPTFPA